MKKKKTWQQGISEMFVDSVKIGMYSSRTDYASVLSPLRQIYFVNKSALTFLHTEDSENAAGLGIEMYVGLKGECSPEEFDCNPFKKKISFSYEGELTFDSEITDEVSELCNFLIPKGYVSRCVPYSFVDRYFNDIPWMSRYLANYEFNRKMFLSTKKITAYVM